jgi:hypothetical protein
MMGGALKGRSLCVLALLVAAQGAEDGFARTPPMVRLRFCFASVKREG